MQSVTRVAGNLFSYLKQYLDLDIPSTKQLWELIMAEDEAFKKNLSVIDPLATSQESAIEKREVEKLANGIVEGLVITFLEKRRQFARDTKAQQAARIIESEKLREYYKSNFRRRACDMDAEGNSNNLRRQHTLPTFSFASRT
jgi:hypothetical protein